MKLSRNPCWMWGDDRWPLIMSVLSFLLVFLTLVYGSGRGFDITDESHYLLSAKDPYALKASVSQAGHYTYYLYSLADGNIKYFRLLGMGLLLILSAVFTFSLIKHIELLGLVKKSERARINTIFFTLLSSGLAYYLWLWLTTPSYNWVALIAVLLVGAGLLEYANAALSRGKAFLIAGLMVGVGGGLAFVGKLTSALVLAGIAGYWLLVMPNKKKAIPFLFYSLVACVATLYWHFYFVNEDIHHYFDRVTEGIRRIAVLGSGHSLLDRFLESVGALGAILVQSSVLLVFGIGVVYACILFKSKALLHRQLNQYLFFLVMAGTLIAITLLIITPQVAISKLYFVMSFSGLFAALLLVFGKNYFASLGQLATVGKSLLSPVFKLSLFLFMLSFAYAFGSGNGLVVQATGAFIFIAALYSVLGLYYEKMIVHKGIYSIAICFVIVTLMVMLLRVALSPYRLPASIFDQSEPVSFHNSNSLIFVDEKTAKYVNGLRMLAVDAGWKAGSPLIELSGASPGASVILDAKLMDTPWLLGGYSGSRAFALEMLRPISKEVLNTSWLLLAPEGKQRIDTDILEELGLEFPGDYERVGEVVTGYRKERQELWKPVK